jgi:hypothetical protein
MGMNETWALTLWGRGDINSECLKTGCCGENLEEESYIMRGFVICILHTILLQLLNQEG